MRASSQKAGFTVIEVLIAVAVMSLMLVSILKVLSAVRITRDRIHNTQETQLAGPIIMDQIHDDLMGLHILGRPRTEHLRIIDRVQYGLDADRIDFVSASRSREPVWVDGEIRRAQVCEIGYVTRPNPDDDEFLELYRREDYGVDEEPFSGGSYTFLSNRVKSFSIEVFESDELDQPAILEWGATPSPDPEHQGLPASIVISMTLENTPRLLQEQLEFSSNQLMTVTYKRTIRFPEALRAEDPELAFLAVPEADNGSGAPGSGNEAGQNDLEVGGSAAGGRGGGGGGGAGGTGRGGNSRTGGGSTLSVDGGTTRPSGKD
ncbi:MAG: prepilin-type N-terminal cleavage/methylation domain-containing protein [Planctomycetes bacterium]|nr:prepilin-type N-terminal cleavage/methylation domain-containing protein [Planctomycetota bacterium]MCB9909203.1 prepilin-type N-terminal cleavage/methylation domain-containing protein [Planctomycetota bacterium]MCB9913315.1 prepilin-type N-terminal cleavage/methylation domain-containing protein [Planctomycetota bacterium]